MNKYRFIQACGTRQFNLINIHLLIFPFWSLRPGRHPLGLPSRPRQFHTLSSTFSSFSSRGPQRGRTCARGWGVPSNYFIRGIPARICVRAFILRLLTAGRILRKPATSCARLHFINFGFLRFSLCCRARHERETYKSANYFSLQRARLGSDWRRECERLY